MYIVHVRICYYPNNITVVSCSGLFSIFSFIIAIAKITDYK